MNNPRLFLWIAVAMLGFLLWETWQQDYGPQGRLAQAQAQAARATPASGPGSRGPGAAAPAAPAGAAPPPASAPVAAAPPPGAVPAPAGATAAPPAGATTASASAGTVRVVTDVLDLVIGLQGGTLERADLLKYPKVKGQPTPVRLLNQDSPETEYELQTGLTGPGNHPTHLSAFSTEASEYRLAPGQEEIRVPLTWTDGNGVTVTKTFVLRRGQYAIGLEYDVKNASGAPWQAAPYAQILRNDPPTERSYFNVESYAFHGPAIYDGTKYRKLDIHEKENAGTTVEVKDGWLAALQHHFVSAIVPPKDAQWRYTLGVQGNQYLLSGAGPVHTIAPGATDRFGQTLFVGPKLQSQLAVTGTELQRVADYGRLTILAQPLFTLLQWVHGAAGNWGIAIIVVTFLLKLLFYPLSETSGKSMAKMRTLAPRIKNLQETYADDREKLGRAMMELYQREKVNPVAGCLPIVVQIPVFLAFYWVLLESVEMRQAPFAGWINDLSARDPYFVLPLIMAGAMFVQYKLNPAPPDPVQAKVFMIMPLVMSAMFAFFPAGLVLYWVTNTLLSIAQQWNINRRIEAAAAARKA